MAGHFTSSTTTRLLLLLCTLSTAVRAQDFGYTIAAGTVTITSYKGAGGAVNIPGSINGLPVTSVGGFAFFFCTELTSVTIPDSVTDIGSGAFFGCTSLTGITIPDSVTSIGHVPGFEEPFVEGTFQGCMGLTGVYFEGNAPADYNGAFADTPASIYFLPGTIGWVPEYSHRPTAVWVRPEPVILDFAPGFGVRPSGFSFIVSRATNVSVLVEACTNLAEPAWMPVSTHTLTSGTATFTDPDWAQSPARFYRVRSE
jgi:hypothetical protein